MGRIFSFLTLALLSSCGLYPFRPPIYNKAPGIYIQLDFPQNTPTVRITIIPDKSQYRFRLHPWNPDDKKSPVWMRLVESLEETYGHVKKDLHKGTVSLLCRRICEFSYKLPTHTLTYIGEPYLVPQIASHLPVQIYFHHRVSRSYSSYCGSHATCTVPQMTQLKHQFTWWAKYYTEQFLNWEIPTTWIITDPLSLKETRQVQTIFEDELRKWTPKLKKTHVTSLTLFISPKDTPPQVLTETNTILLNKSDFLKKARWYLRKAFSVLSKKDVR